MTIEALRCELPPATLLLGPDLERMTRLALYAVNEHGVVRADLVVARHLSAADARNLVKFAGTAPFYGPFKAVIAALDGATAQAQNILLKVLEEPPESIRFILVATATPLPAIVSRCQVITVPAAAGEQEADGKVVSAVHVALKAAAAGDLTGLDVALAGWGDEHHSVLSAWLAEAARQQWDSDAAIGLTQAKARRLLGVLGRYDGAHPRLAVHAALVTVLASTD